MTRRRKLTNAQARRLREQYATGASISALAASVELDQSAVRRVLFGKSYKDAGGPIAARPGKGKRGQGATTTRAKAGAKEPPATSQQATEQLALLERVIDTMVEHPGQSAAWYARHLGEGQSGVRDVIRGAEGYGYVRREGKARATKWWVT